MPVDRGLAQDLAAGLGDLYRDVEARLAADIARRLAGGIEAPGWAQRKLGAIGRLKRFVQTLLGRLQGEMAEQVGQALVLAYMRGNASALDELARLQSTHPEWLRRAQLDDPGPRFVEMIARRNADVARDLAQVKGALPGADALQRMMFSLIAKIQGTHLRILRWDLDAYRTVIARASADTLIGTKTRLQAAQSAMDQLLSQGITGFQDKAGRNWELASYVEMATRSTVAQASVEGHLDRLKAAGIGLVIVSDHAGECELCRPFEGAVLSIAGPPGRRTIQVPSAVSDNLVTVDVRGSLAEAFTAGLMHPNCFPGDVLVSAPSGTVAADARWYEGPLVVIHTASGDELPVTPNHPVLTPEGWVAAGQLQIGQRVLRYRRNVQGPALGAPDDQQVETRISDAFDALRQASTMPTLRMPVAAEQFHGDGFNTDVDVVFADRQLRDGVGQLPGESQLFRGGIGLPALPAERTPLKLVQGSLCPAHAVMRGSNLSGPLLGGHPGPLAALGLAAVGSVAASQQGSAYGGLPPVDTGGDLGLWHSFEVQPDRGVNPAAIALFGDAGVPQLSIEGGSVDSHGGRDLVRALSGLVTPDCVVQVEERRDFAGHVYNLQTRDGWYVAAGIVVHNCRHSISAFTPGATRIPSNTEDPEGDKARQRLRYLERQVRKHKLLEAGALDKAAAKGHKANVRKWQGRIRDHVAETGIARQSQREQIGVAR